MILMVCSWGWFFHWFCANLSMPEGTGERFARARVMRQSIGKVGQGEHMLVDWSKVQCVFLDMDGTLLDLHFDNYFWLTHVPQRYAERQHIPLAEAQQYLKGLYDAIAGTMEWYCLDYWSRALDMDVAVLKHEVEHLIAVHPHVTDFLDAVRKGQKRVVLVTNAHEKSLALKMEKTQLGGHFDRLISSHELGVPKENVAFWSRLQTIEPFDRDRILLVDDSLSVLQSARQYGLKALLGVARPDSKQGSKSLGEFATIENFELLIAELVAS